MAEVSSNASSGCKNSDGENASARSTIKKTPMFTAMNAARYQRQELIWDIEDTSRQLICYVAGRNAPVDRNDTLGFVDMLHKAKPNEGIDLMLHTPGGDVDAAEKLISLVRSHVGDDAELRVIIPDFAKSAGTLMALGGDCIVMSDSSELGPIDPQIQLNDGSGNQIVHSVLTYLDAYQNARDDLEKDPDKLTNRISFEKFDPTVVRKFEAVKERARIFAENLLKPKGTEFTRIASEMMDIDQYPSHGQMIGWETAQQIGLNIDYRPLSDDLWQKYWALYCHLRLAIEGDQKIFESNYVSMVL